MLPHTCVLPTIIGQISCGKAGQGKNVDGQGIPLAPGSDWCQKIEGMGHPLDEVNVFDYAMVKQLRGRVFDFSRAYQAEKDWQKYCSMEKDEKFLGWSDWASDSCDMEGSRWGRELTRKSWGAQGPMGEEPLEAQGLMGRQSYRAQGFMEMEPTEPKRPP